jgi:hypothetical protein
MGILKFQAHQSTADCQFDQEKVMLARLWACMTQNTGWAWPAAIYVMGILPFCQDVYFHSLQLAKCLVR